MTTLPSINTLREELNGLLTEDMVLSQRLAIYDMLAKVSDIESGLYRLPFQRGERPVTIQPCSSAHGFVAFETCPRIAQ